jgi:hypothetical protein
MTPFQMQLDFIESIVIPFYTRMVQIFPAMSDALASVRANAATWKELLSPYRADEAKSSAQTESSM